MHSRVEEGRSVPALRELEGTRTGESLLDAQLARVIESAQSIAVVAEELMRELTIVETLHEDERQQKMRHKLVLAPRVLAATEQQLISLLALLKNA